MRVAYLEMHGAGNRILVVDQREGDLPAPSGERVRELAGASTAPAFDQLMWVTRAQVAQNAARYRVFNNDGSEVEQCGNGVRCVARMLAGVPAEATSLTLESPAGTVRARVLDSGLVSVDMGRPEFDAREVPFLADSSAPRHELPIDGQTVTIAVVSMGNPHCVIEVDDVDSAEVEQLGPLIEHHERFPERVNVGFMQVVDRGTIRLRVHERGVGETLACGTGACAAAVTGQRLGLLDGETTVELPGGQLVVSWRGDCEPVWLTGNAELISEGSMDL